MTSTTRSHIAIEIPHAAGSGDGRAWSLFGAGDVCVQGRLAASSDAAAARDLCIGDIAADIAAADIAVANLEGPVASDAPAVAKAGPALSMDAATPAMLQAAGFTHVALANNHIMDHGPAGLAATLAACDAAALAYCGAGANAAAALAPSVAETAGGTVATISICEREFGTAERDRPGAAWCGGPVLDAIADAARRYDVVVVCSHGGVEEIPLPPPERRDRLRAFVRAGAALVLGHHTHVPGPWELYEGGLIFYSLGNFVFDYPGGARYPKTEWGIAVRARFQGRTLVGADVIPVALDAARRAVRMVSPSAHLDYLEDLAAIAADPVAYEGLWQEFAMHVWRTRYERWIARAAGAGRGGSARAHLRGLVDAIARRVGVRRGVAPPAGNPHLLLNLVRNESHRWAIQTALGILCGGDIADRRDAATMDRARALLRWTEEGN